MTLPMWKLKPPHLRQFEKKYIKTGLSDGINIQVKEGLTKESKIKGEEKKEEKKDVKKKEETKKS